MRYNILMIKEKSLVIYKNRPALVTGFDGEKIGISVFGGDTLKVREKDIEVIHPGPCAPANLKEELPLGNVREAWELLADTDGNEAAGVSLKELAELVFGAFTPRSAWAAWELLREGLYFCGETQAIRARPGKAVEEDEKKREKKEQETGERAAFLEKLGKLPAFTTSKTAGNGAAADNGAAGGAFSVSQTDRRYVLDIEALARGQSDKSRTLKELKRSETPEEAHRLLLAAGIWSVWENPYPPRFGLSRDSAKIVLSAPPEEERRDLTALAAYAIDNSWSNDPDDAISLEGPDAENRHCLWVHVADPAAAVLPGSPADIEARDRGATLYLPEGASRMLSPETQALFVLGGAGGSGTSPALSFKITLNPDLTIAETEIIPSLINVTRLSYAEADALITGAREGGGNPVLAALAALAERNLKRRLEAGAVSIELPEAHIKVSLGNTGNSAACAASTVDAGSVTGSADATNTTGSIDAAGAASEAGSENRISVEPLIAYSSASLVKECMIWAGEAAARWAVHKQLPFPFISQEEGERPEKLLDGFAGAWQMRRCMRGRNLSAKPAIHWGLGLAAYTQVTSPLRRYTDLLCHQQIRACLKSGAYRDMQPFSEEEILLRVSAAEAAASAASRAERASRAHWLTVYLSNFVGSDAEWSGVVLDRKGNKATVIIPALGLETQVSSRGNEEPNDEIRLRLLAVKIPEAEPVFAPITLTNKN